MSQRARDRMVGATAALVVLLLVAVAFLLWVSEPVAAGPSQPPRATATPGTVAVEPPTDLAAGETWLGDVVLDAGTVVTPDARLRDVAAVAQDVRTGPSGLTAGSLSVDATVPFEVVAQQLGNGATVRPASASEASVERTVELLGRRLPVVATGTVEVVGGRLVVVPTSIDVGGPDLLSGAVADVVRRLVTVEHTVEGLPDGLVLQDVTVAETGFVATLRGEDVRLVG